MLGVDFLVHEPPELIDYMRRLSERLIRATGNASATIAKRN